MSNVLGEEVCVVRAVLHCLWSLGAHESKVMSGQLIAGVTVQNFPFRMTRVICVFTEGQFCLCLSPYRVRQPVKGLQHTVMLFKSLTHCMCVYMHVCGLERECRSVRRAPGCH